MSRIEHNSHNISTFPILSLGPISPGESSEQNRRQSQLLLDSRRIRDPCTKDTIERSARLFQGSPTLPNTIGDLILYKVEFDSEGAKSF